MERKYIFYYVFMGWDLLACLVMALFWLLTLYNEGSARDASGNLLCSLLLGVLFIDMKRSLERRRKTEAEITRLDGEIAELEAEAATLDSRRTTEN